MKIRPSPEHTGVVMEMGPKDSPLLSRGAEPFRVRRILVPTDFSSCASKAIAYAIPFARQFAARLTLLHVVPTDYAFNEFGAVDYITLNEEARRSDEARLAELIKKEVPGDVATEASVRIGRPVSEIVDAARELEADLLIMSTHGHTGLKHVFLGSVTELVVRHAPCPVLVVREREHEFIATQPTAEGKAEAA